MINKTILEAQKMLTPSQNEMRVAAENFLKMVRGMIFDPITGKEIFHDPVDVTAKLGPTMNVVDDKLRICVRSYLGYGMKFFFDFDTVWCLFNGCDWSDLDITETSSRTYKVEAKIGIKSLNAI